jgi:hypothetical protein
MGALQWQRQLDSYVFKELSKKPPPRLVEIALYAAGTGLTPPDFEFNFTSANLREAKEQIPKDSNPKFRSNFRPSPKNQGTMPDRGPSAS